jgi:MoxR-like ATPase
VPVGGADEVSRRLGSPRTAAPTSEQQLRVINAALFLRRPLLVTGPPGSGKSTLPYRIAHELGLGPVLYWPISSRSSLRDGLYAYDAIGRVQDTAAWRAGAEGYAGTDPPETYGGIPVAPPPTPSIGDFISLGPLGTALLPYDRPRVLLVDELDKSDIDLPNDLLSVFEEGRYDIPELVRLSGTQPEVRVQTEDPDVKVPVVRGRVQCRQFPVVVVTSNGERDFPPAFLRRCLRLDMPQPDTEQLAAMVAAHFSPDVAGRARELIDSFQRQSAASGGLAADQLLNAVHLLTGGFLPAQDERWEDLMSAVWRRLSDF